MLFANSEKKLQIITCTQQKQNWGKVSKQVAETVLEPELISNLVEFKSYTRVKFDITPEERESFADILFSGKKLKTNIRNSNSNLFTIYAIRPKISCGCISQSSP